LAKIPTELYVCVPRQSARGAFHTNIWTNLTRKDTGEGIASKRLLSYLDGGNVSQQYTQDKTGYAGPFDINPQSVGLHATQVTFEGDIQFEPCKSEEITLEVNPNLLRTEITMEARPLSGYTPLKIRAIGRTYEIALDGSRKNPAHPLPLDLMIFDSTSTKRLQRVKTVWSNLDGTYDIECTFAKPGTYRVFVNFLGDVKYCSAWSNNGRTTTITVTGGALPLSFEKTITEVVAAKAPRNYKFILATTEPTAPDGYERAPEWDLDFGILGKYWAFKEKV